MSSAPSNLMASSNRKTKSEIKQFDHSKEGKTIHSISSRQFQLLRRDENIKSVFVNMTNMRSCPCPIASVVVCAETQYCQGFTYTAALLCFTIYLSDFSPLYVLKRLHTAAVHIWSRLYHCHCLSGPGQKDVSLHTLCMF